MKETNEIVIREELHPLVTKATTLSITNYRELHEATELLSQMNHIIDKVTYEKEKVTKPLNEALKAERARWKPLEEMYEGAIATIRQGISAYQTAETKKKADEAKRLAQSIAEGTVSLSEASKKLSEVSWPTGLVTTDSGNLTFRATQTLKITDITKIPRKYLMVDEKLLLLDLKVGKIVKGAEIEIIQVPINRR